MIIVYEFDRRNIQSARGDGVSHVASRHFKGMQKTSDMGFFQLSFKTEASILFCVVHSDRIFRTHSGIINKLMQIAT